MLKMGRLSGIAAFAAMLILEANPAGPIYTVRTSAMEPTFLVGDHVLAPGGEHISDLRRGDVIAFHFPPDPEVVLIKRLIGLPGDHIRIINGILVVNSRTTSEPYVQHSAGANVSPFFSNFPSYADKEPSILPDTRKMLGRYAASGELLIPAGGYFVLGDNRDYSFDSRSWGLIEVSRIIGLVHEIVSSDDPETRMPRTGRVHVPVQRGSLM
jgi:signal peptidase I